MRFAFFGTDDFSVIVLDELKKAGLLPALIVTQPDRPKGRGLALTPPPIKLWVRKNSIMSLQPEKLDFALNLQLTTYSLQLFVVASYGLIIPKHILDIPKHGTLNVHPSLLPKYRGATPIESQILNGEKEIGVTIMLMDDRMDHGPIVATQRLESTNHNAQSSNKSQDANSKIPNGTELREKLAEVGGKLLAEILPKWIAGKIKATPQDHSKATYTKKFTKTDGEIDPHGDPYENFLKFQAFAGSIGTYCYADSMRTSRGQMRKGKVRVVIKSAEYKDGKLHILRVIPEGKKEMSYEEFLRGLK